MWVGNAGQLHANNKWSGKSGATFSRQMKDVFMAAAPPQSLDQSGKTSVKHDQFATRNCFTEVGLKSVLITFPAEKKGQCYLSWWRKARQGHEKILPAVAQFHLCCSLRVCLSSFPQILAKNLPDKRRKSRASFSQSRDRDLLSLIRVFQPKKSGGEQPSFFNSVSKKVQAYTCIHPKPAPHFVCDIV